MNIPHTGLMSALDLWSGYFQMAVNPSEIFKTAFVTKNGTYAFLRMPFGLSGVGPNFQKAINIILKLVIGKFVSVYMDDVIISPSFTKHVKHLKEVFRLLHEAGLMLNKDKCKFGYEELKYLGLIINKEGIKTDEIKVQAIVEMKPPHNSKEVSKFLGMSQWNEIMREFHDKPLAGHFGRFKTYRKIRDTRPNTETKHENWKKYYNRRRRDVQIKVNDWVLVATHPLRSATRKVVGKFKPKFGGPYRVLDVKNNNVVIWKAGKRLTINVDQVRIYRHRKCDETEIGTGSPDNGSLRDESSGSDRVQRRSNDSRDGKMKGSEVKRELQEKGLSFRNDQGEKHTNKTNKRGPLIRSIPSSWSEKGRMIKKSKKQKFRYKRANESRSGGPERKVRKGSEHRVSKRNLSSNDTNSVFPNIRNRSRREETVAPTSSGYNLKPRIGKREKSPDRP
ncbi:retrovirus-related Pol polyprotein from transposon opus [Trichonephila clavipes]|nr:retrovirus-related Pol polyprotein from transposon opus [Trichonephila clavipes]